MLTLWRFTDGKRGHENQSLGLVEALCRLTPCKVETLSVTKGWPFFFNWLFKRFAEGKPLPKPDLIIGAGHATHWPMLAARRAHGGKIAVLMKPSLPLSWFDWVIAPEHDFPGKIPPTPPLSRGEPSVSPLDRDEEESRRSDLPRPFGKEDGGRSKPGQTQLLDKGSGGQSEPGQTYPLDKGGGEPREPGDFKRGTLILTRGPINRIQRGTPHAQTGLMLIGGPSSEYGWSETALLKQIHLIALHQPEITWHLTTSRRTPKGFLTDLERLDLPNLKAVAHDQVSPGWLPAQLSQASQIWVTPDSASMVYEALTSGAAVGCFEMPFLKPGRVAHGLQKLARENQVTEFSEWERLGNLKPNTHPLNEAERCAKALLPWLKKD